MMEDRLRDAYQAATQTVTPESIRGLNDQAGQPARPGVRAASPARSRRTRVLVPLAAAAAVALIAVAGSLVIPGGPPGHGSAAGALPRFFLALPNSQGRSSDNMAVFSATTGRQLALVKPPRDSVIDTAAATGNDRIFVVTVQSGSSCSTTTLYRLQLTARGTPGGLAPLAIPKISGVVTAMAASSDGRTIAYATAFCGKGDSPGAIGVVHTGTGQTRQWTWRPDPGQSAGSVSITANGRMIEYAASANKVTGPGSGQTLPPRTIRLLPADAPPGKAAQRSRAVVTISLVAPAEVFNSAAMAPDGRTLYFCTEGKPDRALRSDMVLRGYNVATGATSVLHNFGPGTYCMLGVSGDHLLVGYGPGSRRHPPAFFRYDVSTGKSTPVPVPRQWGMVATNIPW